MIEPRVHAAALEVYAARGWYAFSLEAVGKRAGVGPASLYRRWSSKAQLLAEAITAAERPWPRVDTGSSRDDLLALARHLVLAYRGPSGVVGLRMVLDARSNPELAEQYQRMLDNQRSRDVQQVVRRALRRGDLRAPATVGLVLQQLIGATLAHVLLEPDDPATPPDRTTPSDERFLTRLVDSLLA